MKARPSGISWTGEFFNRSQEQALADTSTRRAFESARLCVIATSVTSLGFAPLDVMTLPTESLPFFLSGRLLIALLCIAIVVALSRATSHRSIVALTYSHQYVFFTLNALMFNHPVLLRHGGVLLPLIAISLMMFLPGSFRAAATLCAFAPTISLVFWGVLRDPPETPQDLAIVFLMTLVAYLVGAVARSQFSRMRREEYLHIERERLTNQNLLEAKESAEAGARAKADFLAVMSHEIRTPMNGVLGMVSLVLDSPLAAQDRDRLETACQSAEGLLTILDDILDISKLEAGRFEFEYAPFHLRHTLESVAALMESRIKDRGLSLALDLSPTLPDWVTGDAARLRQILFNLVGNAVKFTETGSVTVRATTKSKDKGRTEVEFAVIDTGIGIDESQRARMFLPFSQADASINRRFGGTGLGLVICKRLVEGLGGTIGVDSTPGQGSCFRFQIAFTPAEPPAMEAVAPEAVHTLRPLSVLLAEDNVVNQQVAVAFLEREGHRVTLASNGAQAVEHARGGGFDLILMDMQMPEVDGLEATRRIRALPGPTGTVPIIALTANAMRGDVARCRAAGMNAHIAKPIKPRVLHATIASLIGHADSAGKSADVLLVGNDTAELRGTLTGLGHRVFPAARDAVALSLLQARPFDVVLVASLPETASMPPLVAEMRNACAAQTPPPLILIAAADGCDMDAVLAAGADEVLPSAEMLAAAIERHMQNRESDTQAAWETLFSPERMNQLRTLLVHGLREQSGLLEGDDLTAEELARIAHRIKGSAANMRLADLLSEAERAALMAEKAGITTEEILCAQIELRTAIETVIVQTQARLSADCTTSIPS